METDNSVAQEAEEIDGYQGFGLGFFFTVVLCYIF